MSSSLQKIISSEYTVEKEIKRSNRGSVSLVRNRISKQRFIYREFAGESEVYYKLLEIESPYLPRIEAVEEEDGVVFVLEEYIQGDTLAFLLEYGSLPEDQAKHIMVQLCDALEVLHECGIVHRDIKPENVILRGDEAVLIDFDASRVQKLEKDTDTRTMGTAGYAAPEQYGLAQTDDRSDIYALGVLLNEMLIRQHPSKRLAEGNYLPIISKCLEINVDRRYTSVGKLRDALEESGEPQPEERPGRRGVLWLTCGLLVAGLLLLGVLLLPKLWGDHEVVVDGDGDNVSVENADADSLHSTDGILPADGLLSAEHELTEADLYDLSQGEPFANGTSAAVPFELNGNTYYMAVGQQGETYPNASGYVGTPINGDATRKMVFDISFYTKIKGEEYIRIEDAEILDEIRVAFGESLSLEMKALDYAGVHIPVTKVFPAIYQNTEEVDDAPCIYALMGHDHAGLYVITARGTIDGQELTTHYTLQWSPQIETIIQCDPDSEVDVITQINTQLASLKPDPYKQSTTTILIPAGEYHGYILVPESTNGIDILLQGVERVGGNSPTTVIHGGVIVENNNTYLFDIRFLGAGSEKEIWEDPNVAAYGQRNYAVSGDAQCTVRDCVFEDYHVALDGTDAIKTGTGNAFYRNDTAIYLNGDVHLNGQLCDNYFEENQVAMDFVHIPADYPMTALELQGNNFLDNEVDIRNTTGREISLTECTFEETGENGAVIARECRYVETVELMPEGELEQNDNEVPADDDPANQDETIAGEKLADGETTQDVIRPKELPGVLTDGVPVEEPVELTIAKMSIGDNTELHQVTSEKLNNGYMRFTMVFTAPKGVSTCVYDPPDGIRVKIFPGLTEGNRSMKQFDLPMEKLATVAELCLNFWNHDFSDRFYLDIRSLDLTPVQTEAGQTQAGQTQGDATGQKPSTESSLPKFPVVRVGDNRYTSLAEAMEAANFGDTVTLIDDVKDAGEVTLKAGVTLDGCGFTISGKSMIKTASAGRMIVKNVNFKDITGMKAWAGAIDARGITSEADLIITGCTFDNTTWYSICVYTNGDQANPPSITIANNIFTDSDQKTKDEVTGKATCMTHIYLATLRQGNNLVPVPINLTIKNNQMYGDSSVNLQFYTAEGSQIKIAKNYLEDQESIRMTLSEDGTEATHYQSLHLIESFYNEDFSEVSYPEVVTSKGLYTCGVFYDSLTQVPWEDMLITETIYLMRDITIEEEVNVVGTLMPMGHTITLLPGGSITHEKELPEIVAGEGYALQKAEENGVYRYWVDEE